MGSEPSSASYKYPNFPSFKLYVQSSSYSCSSKIPLLCNFCTEISWTFSKPHTFLISFSSVLQWWKLLRLYHKRRPPLHHDPPATGLRQNLTLRSSFWQGARPLPNLRLKRLPWYQVDASRSQGTYVQSPMISSPRLKRITTGPTSMWWYLRPRSRSLPTLRVF